MNTGSIDKRKENTKILYKTETYEQYKCYTSEYQYPWFYRFLEKIVSEKGCHKEIREADNIHNIGGEVPI